MSVEFFSCSITLTVYGNISNLDRHILLLAIMNFNAGYMMKKCPRRVLMSLSTGTTSYFLAMRPNS